MFVARFEVAIKQTHGRTLFLSAPVSHHVQYQLSPPVVGSRFLRLEVFDWHDRGKRKEGKSAMPKADTAV